MRVYREVPGREQVAVLCRHRPEGLRATVIVLIGGHEPVGFPARLGAHPPVPAPPSDDRGEEALPRVAVAESTVGEDLDPDPLHLCDILDLGERDLPRQHHAGEPLPRGPGHALAVVDRHLGGGVERKVRDDLPGKRRHPGILHQDGVGPGLVEPEEVPGHVREFGVPDEGVYGDVDPHTPEVRVIDGGPEFFVGEVRRVVPGPETSSGQVDGVRAGGDRCGQGFRRPGGRKQFRRLNRPGSLKVLVRHLSGTVRRAGLYIPPR